LRQLEIEVEVGRVGKLCDEWRDRVKERKGEERKGQRGRMTRIEKRRKKERERERGRETCKTLETIRD
jgi:hypothetical protein